MTNPATLTVFALVKNKGDGAGRPDCFVHAQDPSGAYEGYDSYVLKRVKPGGQGFLRADLTVTNEGALWATQVSVDCDPY